MRGNARLLGRGEPDRRPFLPSITTVFRPVEAFWGSHWPKGEPSPKGLSRSPVSPLDALLIHLVLDLMPETPTLVDLTADSTKGAVTLIGLTHERVGRVVSRCSGGGEAAEALASYVRDDRGVPLKIVGEGHPAEVEGDRSPAVVVMDVRSLQGPEMVHSLREWIEESPRSLVVLLGLGRMGRCPAMASLNALDSDREFGLVRELGEVLAASTLGLASRRDPALAFEVLERLQALFAGQFGVLDLLKTVNHSAIRAARIDADTMKSHVWSWAVTAEMDQLKADAQNARQKAAEASHEIERLLRTIWESRQETAAAAWSLDEARKQIEAMKGREPTSPIRRILIAAKRRLKPSAA